MRGGGDIAMLPIFERDGRFLRPWYSIVNVLLAIANNIKSLHTFSKYKKNQFVQIPIASFYNIGDRKTNIIHIY